nr:protein fmp42 [Quercus suber]
MPTCDIDLLIAHTAMVVQSHHRTILPRPDFRGSNLPSRANVCASRHVPLMMQRCSVIVVDFPTKQISDVLSATGIRERSEAGRLAIGRRTGGGDVESLNSASGSSNALTALPSLHTVFSRCQNRAVHSTPLMSLVQRVTAIEGTDRELPAEWVQDGPQNAHFGANYGTIHGAAFPNGRLRVSGSNRTLRGIASQRSLRRVISYDALAKNAAQPEPTTHAVAAYNVSTARRLGQVIATVLACWFASGIVFGFAALKPVLIDQGVYAELCTKEELAANVEVCYEQDLRLNFFFAVASTTCNVSALPVGTILDRYGPRVSAVLGCVCLAIGSVLMACAFRIPEFDGYIAGNIWLALGGTFIFVPSFSIANAFPKFSGLIVATVTGAFDASAAIFLFYRLAYDSSKAFFTPERFFFGYLVIPALILIAQLTLMTPDGYKTAFELEQKIEKQEDVTRDVSVRDPYGLKTEIDSDL